MATWEPVVFPFSGLLQSRFANNANLCQASEINTCARIAMRYRESPKRPYRNSKCLNTNSYNPFAGRPLRIISLLLPTGDGSPTTRGVNSGAMVWTRPT